MSHPGAVPVDVSGARLPVVLRVVVVLGAVTLTTVLARRVPGWIGIDAVGYSRAAHVTRALILAPALTAIAMAAWRLLDREGSWALMGLHPPRVAWRAVMLGAAAWLLPALAAAGVMALLDLVQIRLLVAWAPAVGLLVLQIVLVLLLEAVPEEIVFRGYLQSTLARRLPRWPTIVAQAGLFVAWGVLGGGVSDLGRVILFATFAVVMGYLREATGTVWTCVGVHLSFQTVAQLLTGDQVAFAAVGGTDVLQLVAFGLVPFGIGIPCAAHLARSRPAALGLR